jgi:hypothetical protein
MVQVRFINDTTPIEVTSETQETKISVNSETQVKDVSVKSSVHHDDLTGRNLPNQHPISAITGLQEALVEVSDKTFVFEQGIASDTWVIEHNLNKYPSVSLVDSAGTQFDADVEYNDENTCTVRMNGATTGKAFLN